MKKFKPWEKNDWGKAPKPVSFAPSARRTIIGFRCTECLRILPNMTGAKCPRHPDSVTELAYADD
jgi:hypothetical protein